MAEENNKPRKSINFPNWLDRVIGEQYVKENQKNKHIASGLIAPSRLRQTTQTAVLEIIGIKADEIDHKTLRIFARGSDVERSIVRKLKQANFSYVATQERVVYSGGVGFMDVVIAGYNIEVKSVTTRKFWKLVKEKKPQHDHALQSAWYSLGTGRPTILLYVEADTYQTLSFTIYGQVYRNEIYDRSNAIKLSLERGTLPDFVELEPYHKIKKYSPYERYFKTTGADAERILKSENPDIYIKLKNGTLYQEFLARWEREYTRALSLKNNQM